jgi:uncharacterized Fe-S cluster-containing radical SAM superfamily protein
MNDLNLSKFMYEMVAHTGKTYNQLPLSSVCNANCIFCANNMNPFPLPRIGFRSLEDVNKGISLLDPQAEAIRLDLPGRISEGEALLHPDILKILQLVRNKAPRSEIQIETNGTMLTKGFVEKLKPFKPIRFIISYHSDNPEFWQKIFNLGQKHYKIANESFYHLSMNGFVIEGAIVPLPHLVGYADIENTIKIMKAWTNYVVIIAPGYSHKASSELKKILDVDFRELSAFVTEMRKKYEIQLSLQTDLLRPLMFNPYRLMQRSFKAKYRNVLWLLSEAAYERAKNILEDWNPFVLNEHFAFMVRNNTYRGNITCSGLLMVSDFREAIKQALSALEKKGAKIDLMLLPQNAFDRFGDDLKGENYSMLSDEFEIPVWLGR